MPEPAAVGANLYDPDVDRGGLVLQHAAQVREIVHLAGQAGIAALELPVQAFPLASQLELLQRVAHRHPHVLQNQRLGEEIERAQVGDHHVHGLLRQHLTRLEPVGHLQPPRRDSHARRADRSHMAMA